MAKVTWTDATRRADELKPYEKNAKIHPPEQIELIAASIREFGFTVPVLIDPENRILAGHARQQAALLPGMEQWAEALPVRVGKGLTASQKRAYTIADNRLTELGEWDRDILFLELKELSLAGFDMSLTGFDLAEFDTRAPGMGSLADEFGVPPFSVINAREGWWQDRKRAWLALGIQSELGRGETPKSGAVEPIGGDVLGNLLKRRARNKAARVSPGGSPRPAADYSKRERGNGAGRPLK